MGSAKYLFQVKAIALTIFTYTDKDPSHSPRFQSLSSIHYSPIRYQSSSPQLWMTVLTASAYSDDFKRQWMRFSNDQINEESYLPFMALSITSFSLTLLPLRFDSSAASMKAYISIISASSMGDCFVLKKAAILEASASYPSNFSRT